MAKRKADGGEKPPPDIKMDIEDEDGSGSGSDDVHHVFPQLLLPKLIYFQDSSTLNVEFDYFDPSPSVDFHGLKTLLRQLFDADNTLIDLSELADMILAQPTVGSTIKCDGQETDPYAFLTVLNLHTHSEKPAIQKLVTYLLERGAASTALRNHLARLIDPASKAQVGLVLGERFVNLPHQLIPPMYSMLLEEIQWAVADKESYNFTHYLILSKTYTEMASRLNAEADDDRPPVKKAKAKFNAAKGAEGKETLYFHPEDEVWERFALASAGFGYVRGEEGQSDSKRAFQELGVRPQGHLILLERGKFQQAVKEVKEFLAEAVA